MFAKVDMDRDPPWSTLRWDTAHIRGMPYAGRPANPARNLPAEPAAPGDQHATLRFAEIIKHDPAHSLGLFLVAVSRVEG